MNTRQHYIESRLIEYTNGLHTAQDKETIELVSGQIATFAAQDEVKNTLYSLADQFEAKKHEIFDNHSLSNDEVVKNIEALETSAEYRVLGLARNLGVLTVDESSEDSNSDDIASSTFGTSVSRETPAYQATYDQLPEATNTLEHDQSSYTQDQQTSLTTPLQSADIPTLSPEDDTVVAENDIFSDKTDLEPEEQNFILEILEEFDEIDDDLDYSYFDEDSLTFDPILEEKTTHEYVEHEVISDEQHESGFTTDSVVAVDVTNEEDSFDNLEIDYEALESDPAYIQFEKDRIQTEIAQSETEDPELLQADQYTFEAVDAYVIIETLQKLRKDIETTGVKIPMNNLKNQLFREAKLYKLDSSELQDRTVQAVQSFFETMKNQADDISYMELLDDNETLESMYDFADVVGDIDRQIEESDVTWATVESIVLAKLPEEAKPDLTAVVNTTTDDTFSQQPHEQVSIIEPEKRLKNSTLADKAEEAFTALTSLQFDTTGTVSFKEFQTMAVSAGLENITRSAYELVQAGIIEPHQERNKFFPDITATEAILILINSSSDALGSTLDEMKFNARQKRDEISRLVELRNLGTAEQSQFVIAA